MINEMVIAIIQIVKWILREKNQNVLRVTNLQKWLLPRALWIFCQSTLQFSSYSTDTPQRILRQSSMRF